MKKTRNSKLLASFTAYCNEYPEQRFWQALLNWSGFAFIYKGNDKPMPLPNYLEDTFYFEEKDN